MLERFICNETHPLASNMAGLKVYYDLMSQPSRAVYMFLKINNIPFEAKPVALRKGEHLAEDFKQINPFHLVPAIDDDGFKLTESVAILKYLSSKYRVREHWYPSNLLQRARVDEYMAWQHFNTRFRGSMVFRSQVIEPRAKNIPVDQDKLRRFKADLEVTLNHLENVFLKESHYLGGGDDITIADLLAICELMQVYATRYDLGKGRPKLSAYIERVKTRLEPVFDEAHVMVYKVRDAFSEAKI